MPDGEVQEIFPDAVFRAYLTGRAGRTKAWLVFQNGKIVGTDDAAVYYQGEYDIAPDRKNIFGVIHVSSPAGPLSIVGPSNPERSFSYDMSFELPVQVDLDATVYHLDTPYGPINARFKKERAL